MKTSLVALPLLLVAVGCSSSDDFAQPKETEFSATCRPMAGPVLALGKTLHALGTKAPSQDERNALKAQQDALRRTTSSEPAVQDLVTKVGIVRIRTDTNSYSKDTAAAAFASYQAVVKACT